MKLPDGRTAVITGGGSRAGIGRAPFSPTPPP